MDKTATLRKKLIRAAVTNPDQRDRLLPIIAKLVEAAPTYKNYVEQKRRKGEKPLDQKAWERRVLHKDTDQTEMDLGGKKPESKKDEKKPGSGKSSPLTVKPEEEWTQADHNNHHKSPEYSTGKVKGYYPQKEPPGLKPVSEVKKLPKNVQDWMGVVTSEDLDKNESYNHPGLKKVKKQMVETLGKEGILELFKVIDPMRTKLHEKFMSAPTDEAKDQYRFPMRRLYHVWQAANDAIQDPKTPDKPKGVKTYTKKYKKPVTDVMDAYSLTDDDAEAVKDFKKKKPARGKVELSPAQLMANFLKFAKPETKERMKGVTPAEFMKMLGAIMDEEEGMGKAATDKTAGLVKRIDRVKLTYTLNAFLEYMLGDPTDAILRLRKLRLPSVVTDGFAGPGSALYQELFDRWLLITTRVLMKYRGVVPEEDLLDPAAEGLPVMAFGDRALRKELLKLAVQQPDLRDKLMPIIKGE